MHQIKYIDLNEDGYSLVDKEVDIYLGHVSSIKTSEDHIYIAYVKGHGRGQGLVKVSKDLGETWSERLWLPESWSTLLQVPVLYEYEYKHKRQVFMVTGHLPFRWSKLVGDKFTDLKAFTKYGGNLAFSSFIKRHDGLYMGFFHDDGRFLIGDKKEDRFQILRSGSQILVEKSLKDKAGPDNDLIYESYFNHPEGNSKIYRILFDPKEESWSEPKVVLSHPEAFLGEAAVFYCPDKSQIIMLLRENTRKFLSMFSISHDQGQSWSHTKAVHENLSGDRHIVKYADDGRLVVVFRDSLDKSTTYGDWVAWIGTYDDIVFNRPGQYKVRLKKNYKDIDCGYSGLEHIGHNTFLAISYGHWTKDQAPYIISQIINLNELDEVN